MDINTLVLNGNKFRYSIHENGNSNQFGIFLLGALQDIDSVKPFSEHFSEHINCITIEIPGTGLTDTLDATVSIKDQTKMLLELIVFLGIEKAHVMAFSYATAIAVELCDIWTGVSSMSICGGVPGIPLSGRSATKEMIADSIRGKEEFAKTFTNSLMSDNKDIPRNKVIKRAMIKNIKELDDSRINSFFENTLRLLVHKPINLDKINIPCTVAVGEHDPYVTQDICQKFSDNLSNSNFVIIRNSDHLVHLQHPDKVARVLIMHAKYSEKVISSFRNLEEIS